MNEKTFTAALENARTNETANELFLYANNDRNTYFSSLKPVINNLCKKADNGIYDREKAVKAYTYVMEYAAKRYVADFGGVWYTVFTKADREDAARIMEDYCHDDLLAMRTDD